MAPLRTLALTCLLGIVTAPAAYAGPRSSQAPQVPAQTSDLQVRIAKETANLEVARAGLVPIFEEAYAAYPALTPGILEALAYAGSRWRHLQPAAPFDGHHNMPQAYGPMGLYHGQGGFGDGVTAAAKALGVSAEDVISSPRLNILGVAALIDAQLQRAGLYQPEPEALTALLGSITGLPGGSDVRRFAQESHAFDVLLAMDRGVDEAGMSVPNRAIDWDAAFDADSLALQRAPRVRVIVDEDRVLAADGSAITQADVESHRPRGDASPEATTSTDYPPALWVATGNYSSRGGTAISHVAIHTTQGSYSGAISWIQNPDSNVSAHYVLRSSDGQVTQMVREYDKAWHVGSENPYTIGLEHEGWVDTSSYYTNAMYNSSSDLTKDICRDNGVNCSTAYDGPSHSGVVTLSQSYQVKGHQHYPNQDHTDPGIYWDWPRYADLVGGGGDTPDLPNLPGGWGGGGPFKTVFDDFETGEGHFNTVPTYSGSTTGISTSSTADRTSELARNGSYSERITLVDNSSTSASWSVRFLSASGTVSANVPFSTSSGRISFWIYSDTAGLTASPLIDDSDGMESGADQSIPTGRWTMMSWPLTDSSQWSAWFGGNGAMTSGTVTLDSILIKRASGTSTAKVYIDDVGYMRR